MTKPPKPARTVGNARRLRSEMLLPEVMLWQKLRGSPEGVKFRRQHPAGPFVLDFYCAKAHLAVEIDGEAHNRGDRPQRDAARDAWLDEHRIDMLRIPAIQVLKDCSEVAEAILGIAAARIKRFRIAPPSPCPEPDAGTSLSQGDGEENL